MKTNIPTYLHTYTHTYTYMHTYMHHTCAHTYVNTDIPAARIVRGAKAKEALCNIYEHAKARDWESPSMVTPKGQV